jgi:NAD-dependent SIR2 family protein deacetylase
VKFVFKIKTNEKKLVVLTGAGISAESGSKLSEIAMAFGKA